MAEQASAQRVTRTFEEIENEILKRVLLVTLVPSEDPKFTYLEQLAAELLSEDIPLQLSQNILDRVIVSRVSDYPVESSPNIYYLLECYSRALNESRKVSGMKDKDRMNRIQSTLQECKELSVSYFGLSLQFPDMFSQSPFNLPFGISSPLTRFLIRTSSESAPVLGNGSSQSLSEHVELPTGFLDQLVKRFEGEGLNGIFEPVFSDFSMQARQLSLLGPFLPLFQTVEKLLSYPSLAKIFVLHPQFLPLNATTGRMMEKESLLGPFLHISVIPDPVLGNGFPDVREQLYSKPSERRASDISSAHTSVRSFSHQLWKSLHALVMPLLKTPETRERVLSYLATLISLNSTRSQMQVDYFKVASDGFFLNLGSLMLHLCEPFLDLSFSKLSKIDSSYIFQKGGRMDFSELTALYASSNEISSWVDQRNLARQLTFDQVRKEREKEEMMRFQKEANDPSSSSSSSPSNPSHPSNPFTPSSSQFVSKLFPSSNSNSNSNSNGHADADSAETISKKYHFITECFFMAARCMNLGIFKLIETIKSRPFQMMIRRDREALEALERMRGQQAPSDLEQRIENLRSKVDKLKEIKLCYESALQDTELVKWMLNYYHMMIVWISSFVGGFHLPLPVPNPMELASIPEHFVDDAMQCLLLASTSPSTLDLVHLDDFMSFIVMFMGSPLHIKNPYLRAKMVEVLEHWMPGHCHPAMQNSMSSLFDGHPLAMSHLTPNLLNLYVDIEFTGSHNAFYDKFNIRIQIANLLEYLWSVPSHRSSWIKLAVNEERGFYLKFLSLLINDSIYLLDDSLAKIPKLKEEEAFMSDPSRFNSLSPEERRSREEQFHQDENIVKYDMQAANQNVKMIQYSSKEIFRPFLLPEMVERIAGMLNYFLLQLAGPKRKELRLSNPEKYHFHPKILLSQIVEIYVNLYQGDKDGSFVHAIYSDGRSYRPEIFMEAIEVSMSHGLVDASTLSSYQHLARRTEEESKKAVDMEMQLGDIPDEFLDPIQCTLMTDPVILPSNNTMDRSVIMRHLLSDPKDPFSRAALTPEMLIPDVELKAKIDEFLASRSKMA